MSYLKIHGHTNPEEYPIGMLLTEVMLTRREVNQGLAAQAIALQASIVSVLSKEGQKGFKELIERLQDG